MESHNKKTVKELLVEFVGQGVIVVLTGIGGGVWLAYMFLGWGVLWLLFPFFALVYVVIRKRYFHAIDKSEAQKILAEQLARFSCRSHSDLAPLVKAHRIETYEVRAASGTTYQIEIQFFWDGYPGDTIRVAGSIDDGGICALAPLTHCALVSRTEN